MRHRANPLPERIAAFLAALAVFVRILIPPGFMPAGPAIVGVVICSEHGVASTDGGDPTPSGTQKKAGESSLCPFGWNAAGTIPLGLARPAVSRVVYAAATDARPLPVSPGRGLAAPPPPSQAPPTAAI